MRQYVAGIAELRLLLYVAGLALAAVVTVAGLILAGQHPGPVLPTIALCAIAIAIEHQSVRISPTLEASVAALPFIFAAVVWGPLAAVTVGDSRAARRSPQA